MFRSRHVKQPVINLPAKLIRKTVWVYKRDVRSLDINFHAKFTVETKLLSRSGDIISCDIKFAAKFGRKTELMYRSSHVNSRVTSFPADLVGET